VPAFLLLAAAALLLGSPYRETLMRQLRNQLPPGYSDDQYVVSRAYNYRMMLGITPEERLILEQRACSLDRIEEFQQNHLLVTLQPGVSRWRAQNEARFLLNDRLPMVIPVRYLLVGNLHLVSIPWAVALSLFTMRSAWRVWRQPSLWRWRLYEVLTLAGLTACLLLVFAHILIATQQSETPGPEATVLSPEISVLMTGAFGVSYLILTGVLLMAWRYDVRTRCRQCLQPLRLPMEVGEEGSVLLDTPKVDRVCFQGHGALTMDRWDDNWRSYGDMWEALSQK
jgi:hypothetical protein